MESFLSIPSQDDENHNLKEKYPFPFLKSRSNALGCPFQLMEVIGIFYEIISLFSVHCDGGS